MTAKVLRIMGYNLRLRRVSLGLTRQQFASMIGIEESVVRDIEMGRDWPRARDVDKIMKAFGGGPEHLFVDYLKALPAAYVH